jgi:hypothetical protein
VRPRPKRREASSTLSSHGSPAECRRMPPRTASGLRRHGVTRSVQSPQEIKSARHGNHGCSSARANASLVSGDRVSLPRLPVSLPHEGTCLKTWPGRLPRRRTASPLTAESLVGDSDRQPAPSPSPPTGGPLPRIANPLPASSSRLSSDVAHLLAESPVAPSRCLGCQVNLEPKKDPRQPPPGPIRCQHGRVCTGSFRLGRARTAGKFLLSGRATTDPAAARVNIQPRHGTVIGNRAATDLR